MVDFYISFAGARKITEVNFAFFVNFNAFVRIKIYFLQEG